MGELLIVTGMSGAGKTVALKSLEDMGYYCVDNLPIPLIGKFSELMGEAKTAERAALGIDIRSGRELPELRKILDERGEDGKSPYEILYLDASEDCLIKRYKETRRAHPLSRDGRLETGISAEREKLSRGTSGESSFGSFGNHIATRISSARSFPSALNTGYRRISTSSSMCAFSQIPIISRSSRAEAASSSRSETMSSGTELRSSF